MRSPWEHPCRRREPRWMGHEQVNLILPLPAVSLVAWYP
jgi:hypothetical protein